MKRARTRRAAPPRGLTLIEVMIAMAILLVGVLGLLGAQMVASQQNSAASRQNRATALARDILAAVEQWDYADARLTNDTGNDGTTMFSGRVTAPDASAFDLDLDSEDAAGAAAVVPGSTLDLNGDGTPDYRRFLHIVPHEGTTSTGTEVLGRRVSAAVYWREAAGWRRVVLQGLKYDPTLNKATVSGL